MQELSDILQIQLPTDALGKQEDNGPILWAPASLMKFQDSGFDFVQSNACVAIWRVNQWVETFSLSLLLSFLLSVSTTFSYN